uniref:phosphatidate phosphatase n=1 Tax=Rhipicephalus appendiculatus TaxID=34631 RepID=A0A131YTT2_RHIAP
MDLDRIVPARSASPTVHLAYQCLEGIIQNRDHVWSLLGKVRDALSPAPSPPHSTGRMNYIGRIITNVREFCNEINSATLTGAIDVVVIEQPDGSFATSPFHVRFGKIGVLRSREKIVDIEINGKPVDIHMKLGESGEAFFVEEVTEESDHVPIHLATSPLPDHHDIGEELNKLKAALSQQLENNNISRPDCLPLTEFNVGTDTNDELPTITGTTPATPIPSAPSAELRRPSATRVHKPSPMLASRQRPQESIGVQTESAITGCEEEQDERPSNEAEQPDEPKYASSNSHQQQQQSGKRRRKKKHPIRRRSRINEDPHSRTSTPGNDDQDIFQMDSDFEEERSGSATAIGVTAPSSSSPSPQMTPSTTSTAAAAMFMSRSVTMPADIGAAREEWQRTMTPKRLSVTFPAGGAFHPYSDGDLTPPRSPHNSRPSSPKSDTEYENQMMDANSQTEENTISWTWGELPHIPNASRFSQEEISAATSAMNGGVLRLSRDAQDDKHLGPLSSDEEDAAEKLVGEGGKPSMLGGVLSFMKPTKKQKEETAAAAKDGIFLDDLDPRELDPEVAALYFPKFRSAHSPRGKDDDAESGNGPSLSQSPNSDTGAGHLTLHCLDSDTEERHSIFDFCRNKYSDLAMSLCGGLLDCEKSMMEEKFAHFLVTYDTFCENPDVINNPDLVIRMGGKYYNWSAIAPHLLSLAMFQRPLPEKTLDRLADIHMPKKKKKSTYSWWSWGRTAGAKPDGVDKPGSQHSDENLGVSDGSEGPDVVVVKTPEPVVAPCRDEVILIDPPHTVPLEKIEVPHECKEEQYASTSSEAETSDAHGGASSEHRKAPREKRPFFCDKFKKSLRLSSDEIASLNLKSGRNEAVFSVTTAYQGTTRCMCHIYLWRHDDKIVISDIDGTITKSDVLGHIMPILGRDWAQSGVAKLFTKIHANGYQFLYLSARAIGQAHLTREYLRSVRQGDLWLPDGPLLLSPTSLINAFHKEVIEKKPEEFKISCLRDIQTLFNVTGNPFYAGFGNKINDTLAYRAVGIPVSRIFTINPKGELKLELMHNFLSSYHCLSDVVDHVFPPLHSTLEMGRCGVQSFSACEEFSSFTYWRDPIEPVEIKIEEEPSNKPGGKPPAK